MNIKYIYGSLSFDATITTKEELYDFVDLTKRAIYGLSDEEIANTVQVYKSKENRTKKTKSVKREANTADSAPVCKLDIDDSKGIEEIFTPQEPLASDAQKKYMTKLGITYTDMTTKIEAIDAINKWKIEHNIPLSGKGRTPIN